VKERFTDWDDDANWSRLRRMCTFSLSVLQLPQIPKCLMNDLCTGEKLLLESFSSRSSTLSNSKCDPPSALWNAMPRLKSLSFTDYKCGFLFIGSSFSAPHLTSLALCRCRLWSVSELSNLRAPNLRSLDLSFSVDHVSDFSCLGVFSSLTLLDIRALHYNMESPMLLPVLPALVSLNLSDCEGLDSLTILPPSFPCLTELVVPRNVAMFDPLMQMQSLTSIDFRCSFGLTLASLRRICNALPRLRSVILPYNKKLSAKEENKLRARHILIEEVFDPEDCSDWPQSKILT
jgi:hypothetical protein